MRSVGPLTAAPELADMGVEVAIHAGQACLRMTTDETTEKWANYTALPSDCYSDMDDAKAEALAAYLAERGLALEPDIIAMDRGFLTNWDRIQEENARWYQEYLNTPALRAYYPERQVAGYVENVKSPETYLTPEQLDVRPPRLREQDEVLEDVRRCRRPALDGLRHTPIATWAGRPPRNGGVRRGRRAYANGGDPWSHGVGSRCLPFFLI